MPLSEFDNRVSCVKTKMIGLLLLGDEKARWSRFDTVRKRDEQTDMSIKTELGPVSIQTQSLALRALRKRKPQERQAITFEWKPGFTERHNYIITCPSSLVNLYASSSPTDCHLESTYFISLPGTTTTVLVVYVLLLLLLYFICTLDSIGGKNCSRDSMLKCSSGWPSYCYYITFITFTGFGGREGWITTDIQTYTGCKIKY